jgi:beta-phosphoglucomutase
MDWINHYNLFLFDFDGLLVNTEELHFEAYKRMLKARGITLKWDFSRFCLSAHYSATKLQEDILLENPSLQPESWQELYNEKKNHYMQLLAEGKVQLMEGVEDLLNALEKASIKRCVVTHSPKEQIEAIKAQHKALQSIPHWVTRELYHHPKPHPECYQKAIALFSDDGDKIIGFEDTPRGLAALACTKARPVLICHKDHPGVQEALKLGVCYFESFKQIKF